MNLTIILLGILPLFIFVVLDCYTNMKTAILGAIFLAIGELIFTLIYYGNIDIITTISIVSVLILGAISWKSENSIFFKFQPVILGVFFALMLLIMQILDKPLLIILFQKYKALLPEEQQLLLLNKENLVLLSSLSHTLGWGFLCHSLVVAYAAIKLSSWWWLIIRGIGVYFMIFFCTILVRFF